MYLDRFHSPAFSAAEARGGVAGDRQQQRDGLLGGGDDVGGRRVDHHHAAGGGGRHLDVVQPDPGPGDDLQPRRGGDRLGVDLGGAAHDHRVGVGQRGQQGRPVGAVDVADVEVVGEHVDGGGGQLFGDEDDGGHDVFLRGRPAAELPEAGRTQRCARGDATIVGSPSGDMHSARRDGAHVPPIPSRRRSDSLVEVGEESGELGASVPQPRGELDVAGQR